jgi:hypothetical protein
VLQNGLLDDFIGAAKERDRHGDAERQATSASCETVPQRGPLKRYVHFMSTSCRQACTGKDERCQKPTLWNRRGSAVENPTGGERAAHPQERQQSAQPKAGAGRRSP